jgi:hypothetical protein
MKITICWDVMPYSLVDMDQHFWRMSCLYVQSRKWRKYIIPRCWALCTELYGIIPHNTIIFIATTMRTSWEIILSKCPWKKILIKLSRKELEAWKFVVTYIVFQTMMPPINRSWQHAHAKCYSTWHSISRNMCSLWNVKYVKNKVYNNPLTLDEINNISKFTANIPHTMMQAVSSNSLQLAHLGNQKYGGQFQHPL